MLAEEADASSTTRSIPIGKIHDDAMLVYAHNGERLRPEPRAAAPRLRRHHQHQVDPTPRVRRRAVHHARGDLQVHRPAAKRQGADVHFPDGGEIGRDLPRRFTTISIGRCPYYPEEVRAHQVYSPVAYVLHLNYIRPRGATLDQKSLPKVKMSNRHGFMLTNQLPDVANTDACRTAGDRGR